MTSNYVILSIKVYHDVGDDANIWFCVILEAVSRAVLKLYRSFQSPPSPFRSQEAKKARSELGLSLLRRPETLVIPETGGENLSQPHNSENRWHLIVLERFAIFISLQLMFSFIKSHYAFWLYLIQGQVWKGVWILEVWSENRCGKWHFLVWNRVRIWGGTASPRIPRSTPRASYLLVFSNL